MIKQIAVFSIPLILIFTLVGCENKSTANLTNHEINAGVPVLSSNDTNKPSSSQQANSDGKVYLLEGGINPPTREVLLKKQARVLSTAKVKENAWKPFRDLDQLFEQKAEPGDLFNHLKEGTVSWAIITDHDFVTPQGVTIHQNKSFLEEADEFIDEGENNITYPNVHFDLERVRQLIHDGAKEHDVQKFVEAHKIIHDLHVWVVGYDIPFELQPPNWETIHVFFGVTKTLGKG